MAPLESLQFESSELNMTSLLPTDLLLEILSFLSIDVPSKPRFDFEVFIVLSFGRFRDGSSSARTVQVFRHFCFSQTQVSRSDLRTWRQLMAKNLVTSLRFSFLDDVQLHELFGAEENEGNAAGASADSILRPFSKLKRFEIGYLREDSPSRDSMSEDLDVYGLFTDLGSESSEQLVAVSVCVDDASCFDAERLPGTGLLSLANRCGDTLQHLSVTGFFMGINYNVDVLFKRLVSRLRALRSLVFEREWCGSIGASANTLGSPTFGASQFEDDIAVPSELELQGFECFRSCGSQLRKLALNGLFPTANVDNFSVIDLLDALVNYCPNLESLELQRCAFVPMMFRPAVRLINMLRQLRRLTLDQSNIDDGAVRLLCREALQPQQSPEESPGASILPVKNNIQHLSLKCNKIGKKGLQYLFHNKSLVSLDLSNNLSTQKHSMEQLALSNCLNMNLTTLVMSNLGSTTSSALKIKDHQAKVIFGMHWLRNLDLSGNSIEGVGDTFAPLCSSQCSLEYLDLSHNHIGDIGARLLVYRSCPVSLSLPDEEEGTESAQQDGSEYAPCRLHVLNLNNNRISDSALLSYAQSPQCRIHALIMEENDFDILSDDLSSIFDEG